MPLILCKEAKRAAGEEEKRGRRKGEGDGGGSEEGDRR